MESVKTLVVFLNMKEHGDRYKLEDIETKVVCMDYEDFLSTADPHAKLEFQQLDADHPLYILYSSGTTGSMAYGMHWRDMSRLTRHRAQMYRAWSHWYTTAT